MKKKFTWKKAIYIVLGLLFAVALFSGIGYLVKSNSKESEAFLTRKPSYQNMEDKVMATGKIVPKEEIEIKPNIAGIIDKILVDEGDKVTAGQLIATVRIIPNIADVNNAQQEVVNSQLQISNAKLNVDNMQKQYSMQEKLYKQGVISKQEYLNAQQQLYTQQQTLRNANQQLATAQKDYRL
ncbi:efflux RND transporter periplasmic adaptor subunit [Chryseobacterium carnipullorum]|uniref:efflux RND transporter periplasmic adaptor subunit n=1 Tax=Chryseobacterium carnipullorum TaxID=1124835 RepID=UPI001E28E43B|nr:TolC family protein [Chryseobacterium carnipullorum]